jgi:hypothetical protein
MQVSSIDVVSAPPADATPAPRECFAATLQATLESRDSAAPDADAAATVEEMTAAAALAQQLLTVSCAPIVKPTGATALVPPSSEGAPCVDHDWTPASPSNVSTGPGAVPRGASIQDGAPDPLWISATAPVPDGAEPEVRPPMPAPTDAGAGAVESARPPAGSPRLEVIGRTPPDAPAPSVPPVAPATPIIDSRQPAAPPLHRVDQRSSGAEAPRVSEVAVRADAAATIVEAAKAAAASARSTAADSPGPDDGNAPLPAFDPTPGAPTLDLAAPPRLTTERVTTPQTMASLPALVSELAEHARAASSPRRVVVPLDPPALGHVTVEIVVRADSVRVSLQHANDAALASLTAQRPAIEAALESNGLHLSGFDVSSNDRQPTAREHRATRTFETFDMFDSIVESVDSDGALRL